MPQQVKTGNQSNTSNETTSGQEKRKLNFCIFFDGTVNSKHNIDENKKFSTWIKTAMKLVPSFVGTIFNVPFVDIVFGKAFSHVITRAESKSYWNSYSNIARLYSIMPEKDAENISIYVDGVGTNPMRLNEKEGNYEYDFCSDDKIAAKFGIGEFGIKSKVDLACKEVKRQFDEYCRSKLSGISPIDVNIEFNFYLFGFGRGAASARCFCSNMRTKNGTCQSFTNLEEKQIKNMRKEVVPIPYNLVRCVSLGYFLSSIASSIVGTFLSKNLSGVTGIAEEVYNGPISVSRKLKKDLKNENLFKLCLYDFLAHSIFNKSVDHNYKTKFLGLFDTVSAYGYNFDDDVAELGLDKGVGTVEKAFQICAGDEFRTDYDLTDISSYGSDNYKIIPGGHKDIGGGGKSVLYSLVSYAIMKEQVTFDFDLDDKLDSIYNISKVSDRKIDGIKYEKKHVEKIYDYYKKIKNRNDIYVYDKANNKIILGENSQAYWDELNNMAEIKEYEKKIEKLTEEKKGFDFMSSIWGSDPSFPKEARNSVSGKMEQDIINAQNKKNTLENQQKEISFKLLKISENKKKIDEYEKKIEKLTEEKKDFDFMSDIWGSDPSFPKEVRNSVSKKMEQDIINTQGEKNKLEQQYYDESFEDFLNTIRVEYTDWIDDLAREVGKVCGITSYIGCLDKRKFLCSLYLKKKHNENDSHKLFRSVISDLSKERQTATLKRQEELEKWLSMSSFERCEKEVKDLEVLIKQLRLLQDKYNKWKLW